MTKKESIEALETLIAKAETIPDDYQVGDEGSPYDMWRSSEWIAIIERGKEALACLKKSSK